MDPSSVQPNSSPEAPPMVRQLSFSSLLGLPFTTGHTLNTWASSGHADAWNEACAPLSSSYLSPQAQAALALCDEAFGPEAAEQTSTMPVVVQPTSIPTGIRNVTSPGTKLPSDLQSSQESTDSLPSLYTDPSNERSVPDTIRTGDVLEENRRQTELVIAGPANLDSAIAGTAATVATAGTTRNTHTARTEGIQARQAAPGITAMQCPFNFLRCPLHFSDYDSWLEHCVAHLKRATEPRSSRCDECATEFHSWYTYLDHLWAYHRGLDKLSGFPLDPNLLIHLRNKRIIETTEYQLLLQYGSLDSDPTPLAIMHSSALEKRRRDGRDRPDRQPVIYVHGRPHLVRYR
ncbi:Hypothetical protein D9617_18g034450 [Elsinoe fawcettii]|nr:Hypothetical protein D9617_18g034450 [Elsinoe fawcettii]